MGVYNIYGKKRIQIKIGDLIMQRFNRGDKVDIPDGVYIGYEGVIVVSGGIFVAEFDHLTDKWGVKIDIADGYFTDRNPVKRSKNMSSKK
jgi:hypothetical protein